MAVNGKNLITKIHAGEFVLLSLDTWFGIIKIFAITLAS